MGMLNGAKIMAKDKKMTLQEQVNMILERAEEKGAQTNFFFVTTFKRYQVQMSILTSLEKEISEIGATVKKEYVKGRQNVYTNPAIAEYNRTANAANNTVATLLKIVNSLTEDAEDIEDPLLRALEGMSD